MRLLLDTHVVIWWLADDDAHLAAAAAEAIGHPDNVVFVSAVTGFEVETKKKAGKLRAPDDLLEQIRDGAFEELPVTLLHGLEAGRLPLHHKDPFDRLLVAQARAEDLVLVTADRMLSQYDVRILPAT